MEIPASTGLKSKFHRHTRPASIRSNSTRSALPQGNGSLSRGPSNTVIDTINEHTSLLSRPLQNSDGQPLWEDERPYVRYPARFVHITWQTLASNYVNVLLVFVPLGIIAGALKWDAIAVFILNFLAIIPLASLLSFATEELSIKLGQTLGGLLNATFGNAVELIVRQRTARTHIMHPLTNGSRSASSPSGTARSALCNLACWAPSSPTSSSSLDAAS